MDINKIKEYFNSYYVNVLKTQYADFKGRANRPQYWYFTLFNVLIAFVLGFIDGLIFQMNVISLVYALAVLVPGIALAVRRLHDLGKPWFWLLISLVPLVGGIALIVLFCLKGEDKENAWGPVPQNK